MASLRAGEASEQNERSEFVSAEFCSEPRNEQGFAVILPYVEFQVIALVEGKPKLWRGFQLFWPGERTKFYITVLGDRASNPTSANDSEPEWRIQRCEARKHEVFPKSRIFIFSMIEVRVGSCYCIFDYRYVFKGWFVSVL